MKKTIAAIILGLVVLICVVVGTTYLVRRSQYPPELHEFVARYNQIAEDMREEKVDAILGGYPSSTVQEERMSSPGGDLPRLSVKTKMFSDKPNANESDYFIEVYFDYFGRVVGKRLGEFLR
jgi:hypothetical protein